MKIWSEQAFSARVVDEFLTMLERSQEMLSYSFMVLTQEKKGKKFDKKIYQKDQSINLTEREIRKQVLIHITTHPDCNLSACLALMSISKDAERLGDYVKNIFELRNLLKGTGNDSKLFKELFDKNGKDLLDLFKMTTDAFKNSDKDLALKTINTGHEFSKRCEEIIEKVVKSDHNLRQAVVLALGARYMKRIALHLSNIASSVINPLPELDYMDVKSSEQLS